MIASFFIPIIVLSFFDIGVKYFVSKKIRIYPIITIVFCLLGMFL